MSKIIKDPLIDATILVHKQFANKTDDSGAPYVEHALRVSRRLNPAIHQDTKIIALCHDLIEDTSVTRQYLADTFHPYIGYAVSVLSNTDKISYVDFIDRILACNDEQIQLVKLADLYDNTAPYRLSLLPKERKEYFEEKYFGSIERMEKKLGVRARMVTKGDIYLPI